MSQWITLDTAHGPVRAWQALPAGPAHAGLVVIQEIFGANAHIRHVAGQYAADGYAVLAPAFFDPLEPGLELDYDTAGTDRGKALVAELGVDRAVDIVEAAAHALAGHGKVGTMGYCWGGTIALLAAQRLGLPSASYYGARNVPFLDAPFKAPAIFHFGAQDPSIPPAAVAAHREKQPSMQVYVYPAGHAFNREAGTHYHAPSAALARERTLAFFSENLR
ncbi:MAG: dienelactone hydrolase family protein [Stenotrophomonas nitritireducens]|uniref:dienelactone hydrolase family protein n=1 Tax=Stenotrophomonas nitritireducens TaxID=83617 RepID=UPI001AC3047F|nr:dienelactone hydrolase family protein [Stenotrophomonas nitritireducens]MBN8769690.1 dienelactone hydrolase family protein [Stenotrophomonas sp.]MBN8792235.1 dienelactone hydrolase family protein [Stenotrophomonas nitritireducens]